MLIVIAKSLHKMIIYKISESVVRLLDYGTAIPEPGTSEATEALVFMIAAMTGHWNASLPMCFKNNVLYLFKVS